MRKGLATIGVFVLTLAAAPTVFAQRTLSIQKDRIPTLIAKAVDATGIGEPYVAIAEHEGLVRSLGDFCKYDTLPFLATVTNKVIKEHPAAVVAYLHGWPRAVKPLKEQLGL
jgi:ABC-type nitrate/sulfonate/bicarbonate transport system substrate-binding protein